jgi:hypothetical protein
MEKLLMRVGTETKLNPRDEINPLFGASYEFVHLADYWPWQLVNGTWTGALGHLMDDNRADWKQC